MPHLKVAYHGSGFWALYVNGITIGIYDTYMKAEDARIAYLRKAGFDENGKAFDAEIVNPAVIRKPRRIDIDVESLSLEDVGAAAAEIYGAFGGVHMEPEPETPADFQGHPDYDSFYYGG